MPFSQADVDNLKAAIAEAGLDSTVRFADGSSITNISMADARDKLAMMQADVAAAPVVITDASARPVRAFQAFLRGSY